ncbi:hypothetical protein LTS18_010946 [Coniosporium uncinatum]|uniref:Uncharacterized protein n=1 Tax=Coniosporium uncinatum TaxID=93489 RepID=A0ACC3CZ44_9PEZI|nr:hypothetical protein LTS18_010946 [Coniosporium uncinatum]
MPYKAKHMWKEQAKKKGIIYLEEGMHEFKLKSGVKFKVYASPYQPEFCDWAFPYEHDEDRFNPPSECLDGAKSIVQNPVPDFPEVDVMMTHGPPYRILDQVVRGKEYVGCAHLLRAAYRAKPRLHCFGHIHEGWGAQRVTWKEKAPKGTPKSVYDESVLTAEDVGVDPAQASHEMAVYVDLSDSGPGPLKLGEETLMVNSSIMSVSYKPVQAPWLVDLELPCPG